MIKKVETRVAFFLALAFCVGLGFAAVALQPPYTNIVVGFVALLVSIPTALLFARVAPKLFDKRAEPWVLLAGGVLFFGLGFAPLFVRSRLLSPLEICEANSVCATLLAGWQIVTLAMAFALLLLSLILNPGGTSKPLHRAWLYFSLAAGLTLATASVVIAVLNPPPPPAITLPAAG